MAPLEDPNEWWAKAIKLTRPKETQNEKVNKPAWFATISRKVVIKKCESSDSLNCLKENEEKMNRPLPIMDNTIQELMCIQKKKTIIVKNSNSNSNSNGKRPWTKEEDDIVTKCVNSGIVKWTDVAEYVPGRIGKQCRERWFNQLDPSIKRTKWTSEEDMILLREQKRIGNKWSEIAKSLCGRPENVIKNRWHSTLNPRVRTKKCRKTERQSVKIEEEEMFVVFSNISPEDQMEDDIPNPSITLTFQKSPKGILKKKEKMPKTLTEDQDIPYPTPTLTIIQSYDNISEFDMNFDMELDDINIKQKPEHQHNTPVIRRNSSLGKRTECSFHMGELDTYLSDFNSDDDMILNDNMLSPNSYMKSKRIKRNNNNETKGFFTATTPTTIGREYDTFEMDLDLLNI